MNFPKLGWYKYLWKQLQLRTEGKFEKLLKNEVTFLTFNYDRSLEFFLFNAIKSAYGLTESDVASFFETVQIKHLYGELGVLPWKEKYLSAYSQKGEALNDFESYDIKNIFPSFVELDEYHPSFQNLQKNLSAKDRESRVQKAKKIIHISKQIKTYQEIACNDECEDAVRKAERIYFLGCAYHEQNIRAIGLDNGKPMIKGDVMGTAYGMTPHETQIIRNRMVMSSKQGLFHNHTMEKIQNHWAGLDPHGVITSFFRNVAPFD